MASQPSRAPAEEMGLCQPRRRRTPWGRVANGPAPARGTRLASGVIMATVEADHQDEQAGQLISGVLQDARELAVAEVDKLKVEAINQVKSAGEGAKYAVAGLLLLTLATLMLGVAIAFGLGAAGLPAWLALGLVAIGYGGGGAGLVRLAQDRRRRRIAGAVTGGPVS